MSTAEPVRKEIVVEAPRGRAFRVFTEGIDRWWPRQHHAGKTPLKRAVIEPRAGGRWYAICEDDSECETGKVLAWDPPRRLLLSWQLRADWQYDPAFVTEVEVTFTAEGAKRTRVVLEHRNLERYGEAVGELRKSIDSPGGWWLVLEEYAKAVGAEPG